MTPPATASRPAAIVIMGVAGSGKTTVGELLAGKLGWPFRDADSFHPPANVAKMSSGVPLVDEDRWPWLDAIGAALKAAGDAGIVVTCSALKRIYRDRIRAAAGRPVTFIFLDGPRALLAEPPRQPVGDARTADARRRRACGLDRAAAR